MRYATTAQEVILIFAKLGEYGHTLEFGKMVVGQNIARFECLICFLVTFQGMKM